MRSVRGLELEVVLPSTLDVDREREFKAALI
jgi:hypothetical protein